MSSPQIEAGAAALRAGDAAAARRAFASALAESESCATLEGLAEALYLEREYQSSIANHERAYTAYRRERDNVAAGRAARTVAWLTGNVLGDWEGQNWLVQSGWFARFGDPDVEFFALSYLGGLLAPPELQHLLAAVHGNQEAMDGFAQANSGAISPAEFFSEENVGRILPAAGQHHAAAE